MLVARIISPTNNAKRIIAPIISMIVSLLNFFIASTSMFWIVVVFLI